jgi:hypothetical protein
MNIDNDKGIIYCHGCLRRHTDPDRMIPRDIHRDIYLEGDVVKCLICDSILGYTWDAPKYFHVAPYNEDES